MNNYRNTWQNKYTLRLALLLFTTLPACQKYTVETTRLRAAPIFTPDYRRVAVANLEGAHGDDAADMLEQVIAKQGRNIMIPRPRVVAEQMHVGLTGFSAKQAQKLAQRLSANVVLHGRIREVKNEAIDTVTHESPRYEDDGDRQRFRPGSYSYLRRAHIDLIVDLRLVDAGGHEVGKSQIVARSRAQQETSVWRSFSTIDWAAHRAEAFASLPSQMRRQLSPHQEPIHIVLYGVRGIPEAKAAIEAVEQGDWVAAVDLFRRGLRVAEQRGNEKVRHRAHYNLGVALAFNGALDEGLEHLKIAQMLRPSKELPKIIAQVTTYAKEVEQAKHQLKILGRRPGELEQPPVADQDVPSIEPWTEDDVPMLSE